MPSRVKRAGLLRRRRGGAYYDKAQGTVVDAVNLGPRLPSRPRISYRADALTRGAPRNRLARSPIWAPFIEPTLAPVRAVRDSRGRIRSIVYKPKLTELGRREFYDEDTPRYKEARDAIAHELSTNPAELARAAKRARVASLRTERVGDRDYQSGWNEIDRDNLEPQINEALRADRVQQLRAIARSGPPRKRSRTAMGFVRGRGRKQMWVP